MLKGLLGSLTGCLFVLQALTSIAAAQSADRPSNSGYELWKQQLVQPTASTPEAVVDRRGGFRVRGIVRKKTQGLTNCYCGADFRHVTGQGRYYSQQGQTLVVGNECTMNVPFHFDKADSEKPVNGYLFVYCYGEASLSRNSGQEIRPFPLKNGPSQIIRFDVDM